MSEIHSYQHKGQVSGLTWSTDGSRLFSASYNGELRVWQNETVDTLSQSLAFAEGADVSDQTIFAIDWSAKQSSLIIAAKPGLSFSESPTIPKRIGDIILAADVKCSPTTELVALREMVSTEDKKQIQPWLRVRNLDRLSDTPICDSSLSSHVDSETDIAWAPNGELLAVLAGGVLKIWLVGYRTASIQTLVLGRWANAIAWLTNDELAVTYGDGNIRVFDRQDYGPEKWLPKCKRVLEAHDASVISISVGMARQQFATADLDGVICVWNEFQELIAKRTIELQNAMWGVKVSLNPRFPILAYAQGARVGFLRLDNEDTKQQALIAPTRATTFLDKLLQISELPRPRTLTSDEVQELFGLKTAYETSGELLELTKQSRRIAQALNKIDLLLCEALRQMWAAPTREEMLALEDIELQAPSLDGRDKTRNAIRDLLAVASDNPDRTKRTIAICAYALFSIGRYNVLTDLQKEATTFLNWMNSIDDDELRRQLKLLTISRPERAASEVADELEQAIKAITRGLENTAATSPQESFQTAPSQANENYALVMKGGGMKGLACIGALSELQRFYSFDLYVGTSAGAVIAALLGAGYTADEMERILREVNFADFLGERFKTITNLIFHGGLFRGTELSNWIDTLLAKKLKSRSRVKFNKLPHQVRIYSCKRDTDALIFDSSHSPQISVAHAVRCSIAIPLFFTPERDQGLNVFDGGMRHNYPVKKLLEETPDKKFIGLYLGDSIYTPRKSSILRDLINISTEATDIESLEKYQSETVVIDPSPISTLDFTLSPEEKTFLLSQGRAAALEFLQVNGHVGTAEVETALQTASQHKLEAITARKKRTLRRRLFLGVLLATPFLAYLLWQFATVGPIPFAENTLAAAHDLACKAFSNCVEPQFQWVSENSESVSHAIAADTAFIFPDLAVAPLRDPGPGSRRYGEPQAKCEAIAQNAWKLGGGDTVLDDDPLIKNGWMSPSWVGEPEPPDWSKFDAIARAKFGWTPGFAKNNRCPRSTYCTISPEEIKEHSKFITVPVNECARMRMVEKNYSNNRTSLTVWIRGNAAHQSLWTVTAPLELYKPAAKAPSAQ